MVDLRDDAIATARGKCAAAKNAKLGIFAETLAAKLRGSKRCASSVGSVQSMIFCTAWHDFCELHLELAAW